ncbi:hypothetical protein PENTCL1PPCAC_26563 [Pristionchus entomophagus]|uniref:Uncharacterized protein n=1 Tax=Pristionchus entomophagus TaxID=358040 RepID=A0AAV5UEE6_9BILA|nr:hypothetical protein PENTCL1PPCAC_26563 [Pristionchus entomophagus]
MDSDSIIDDAARCSTWPSAPTQHRSLAIMRPPLSLPPDAFDRSITGREDAVGQVRLVFRCLPSRSRDDVIHNSLSSHRQLSIGPDYRNPRATAATVCDSSRLVCEWNEQ